MTPHDDDTIRKPVSHEIGMKVDDLSVDELDHRISLLRAEIGRLEAVKTTKQGALLEARHDDDTIRKPVSHEIGMKVDDLSVDELDHRISLLRAEIGRLEAVKTTKQGALLEARLFFKT